MQNRYQILSSLKSITTKEGTCDEEKSIRFLDKGYVLKVVERIFFYGKNEKNEVLKDSKWFRQQLRLTADNRVKHLMTTGASQISKSLANYLVAVDDIINAQISIGWFYASRGSMQSQQPEQFQKMFRFWLRNQYPKDKPERESVTRYSFKQATANFSYANSSSAEKHGGAVEGREQNAFSASKIYLEEKFSWTNNIEVRPRLGQSKIPSKPIRELGTPGSGAGIEKLLHECSHHFYPAVVCEL